jgi:SAM-dependent methyltransferase
VRADARAGEEEERVAAVRSWIEFWDSGHAIYVNDRHKTLHAQSVGRAILGHVPAGRSAVVLDHGCGEALYAEAVAPACAQLILCEAAPRVRSELARRVGNIGNIRVVDPAGVEALGDKSLDLVVANSLVQYLGRDELAALLDLWRRKLKPGGALIVADVISPDVGPVTDAAALLGFAWHGGFLPAALVGLVRTALSDYGKLRKEAGFSTYREAEFLGLLAAHGFKGERIHPNFGHNQARMTFRAKPEHGAAL